ncbi:hypothetical protein FRX31_005048 [Thalictrum thalictroides]|uniref:Uncharacterized protein n=1 Tax=Thalictrum thalictroides TaxID=46969 RepID=A0A7J6X6P1_THATH|nr:hypothetical protein FRX31_005048 [Thalictrum thalictroides]
MPKEVQIKADLKEYWPDLTEKLIAEFFWMREWNKHGIRSGLLQEDYFKLALKLFKVVRNYWEKELKIQEGSTINLAELDKKIEKIGVPQFKCNNYNKRQQLYEMRFNWTKGETFELNYDTSDCAQMISFPR